jgi:hypothetical protein
MGKRFKNKTREFKDIRVAATGEIWGFTLLMMGVCVPLSAVTKSGAVIPLAAMTGATIGTVAVWRSKEDKNFSQITEIQTTELLEKRIADLETIISSSDFDLEQKLKKLEGSDRL